MPFQPGANLYTQGFGSRPENVEVPHLDVRAPASTDINYPVGKAWLNTSAGSYYVLVSLTTSAGVISANWAQLGQYLAAGTTGVMSGTPGAVTTSNATVTASSIIIFSRNITGGTPGQVSITAQTAGSFTLTSTGNETSTFNYYVIN